MGYNRKEHLRGNVEAIRTAFELSRERRKATTAEMAVFGGIKAILKSSSAGNPR